MDKEEMIRVYDMLASEDQEMRFLGIIAAKTKLIGDDTFDSSIYFRLMIARVISQTDTGLGVKMIMDTVTLKPTTRWL